MLEVRAAEHAAMRNGNAQALMVNADVRFITQRARIVELAARNRMPAIYWERGFVSAGGLMFYGAELRDMYRHAAIHVHQLLGAKPADLPVEQPTRLKLIINIKTAKALGLTIPSSLLVRADGS